MIKEIVLWNGEKIKGKDIEDWSVGIDFKSFEIKLKSGEIIYVFDKIIVKEKYENQETKKEVKNER
jgi:hypothetical protein